MVGFSRAQPATHPGHFEEIGDPAGLWLDSNLQSSLAAGFRVHCSNLVENYFPEAHIWVTCRFAGAQYAYRCCGFNYPQLRRPTMITTASGCRQHFPLPADDRGDQGNLKRG
jgi:hypothetical protein